MAYNDDYRPGGFSLMPPVIKALLMANVAVFLFQLSPALGDYITYYFALWPIGSEQFQFWQPLTYMFLHGGIGHIFFNMLALWMFGMEIENYWGSKQFSIYYFTCGIGAGLINLLATAGSFSPTVGASGAIYGVLLAFGMMFPDRIIYFYFFVPLKAKYFVAIYAAIEFFSTLGSGGSNVAHAAHLGGMLVGYIYIKIMQREFPFQKYFERLKQKARQEQFRRDSAPLRSYPAATPRPPVSEAKVINEKRVDEILDKISKKGYDSLSEEEKKILLDASKN
jgi:membrane associated rhomboid family serine protease